MGTWYRTGTVAVTNGSPDVVGTSTLFLSQASVGDVFIGPDLALYEITAITDDTHLAIKKLNGTAAYNGSTLSAQVYAIIRNFTSTLPAELASDLAALVAKYHATMDEMVAWLSGTGSVTLHDAAGNAYTVMTPAAVQAGVNGRLSKSVAGSSNVTLNSTEAGNGFLEFTGALTGNINVIVPASAHGYFIFNNTSGAYTLTVKTASGTGTAVAQGARALVECDATNVVNPLTSIPGNLSIVGTLTVSGAITYGGVTLSNAVTGTGNMVLATSPAITTSLTTGSTTFSLVNATASTVNFAAGASTALNIGHASGTNTILGATNFSQTVTLIAPVLGTPASGNLVNATGYVGTSSLVTVGALNSGSITSGFGSIDVGADAISGGAATFTTGSFSGTITKTNTAATSSNFFLASGSTTNYSFGRTTNTSGDLVWGVEGSAAGQVITGAIAYAGFIGSFAAKEFAIASNGIATLISNAAGTGVTIPGTLAVTGAVTIPGATTTSGGLSVYNGAGAGQGQLHASINWSYGSYFYEGGASGQNAAATVIGVTKNSSTSRSINAAGTVNASGADYAEYERKAAGVISIEKGQLVGFDAQGKVTDRWNDAISFGVKSTDPGYTGGDVWGSEEAIGMKRPVKPVLDAPQKPKPLLKEAPEKERTAYDAALKAWQKEGAPAFAKHETAMQKYSSQLGTFEGLIESARQQVDRISYCGKVPVNAKGAKSGDYIIPVELAGGISAIAKAMPTFDEYRIAVGQVRRVLDDGRAEIAVKVS